MNTTEQSASTEDTEGNVDRLFLAALQLRQAAKWNSVFQQLADEVAAAAHWASHKYVRRCELCVHYLAPNCGQHGDKKIPADVLPVGCESFEYNHIPF